MSESHRPPDLRSLVGDKGDVWESSFKRLLVCESLNPGSRGKHDLLALEDLLRTIPIFRSFDSESMTALCNRMSIEHWKQNMTAYVQTDEMRFLSFARWQNGRNNKSSEGRVVEIEPRTI